MLVALLTGCASHEPRERGWIGGSFVPARAEGGWISAPPPALHRDGVVGLPPGIAQEKALLLVSAAPETPLTRAGLRPGDLILSVNGEEVSDPARLRETVEALEPGERLEVRYWRKGARSKTYVVIGTETYLRQGTIAFGLWFNPHLDLWPFDDGIDIFGLVVAQSGGPPVELHDPPAAYLESALPDEELSVPPQEWFDFRIIPFQVGKQTRVLSQNAH